ncbi:MAG: glycosyltransferase family 4 protein [Myxococcota bacterium]
MPTTSYPRLLGDRSEPSGPFVATLQRLLEARGHEVDVLAPAAARGRPAPGAQWVRYAPKPLERTFYGPGALATLARDPLAWGGALTFPAALGRAMRRGARHWDAVLAHWAVPAGLVARLATPRLPRVVVVHGSDLTLLERLPGGGALARSATRGAHVWTVSQHHAARLRRLGIDPALVSPLPADAPHRRDREGARRRLGLGPGPVLFALGRLVALKGHRHLVAAAAALEAGAHAPTVFIGGEGPERARLAKAAREAGLDLRLPGLLLGDAKDDAFAAADVFVQPSLAEGAPLSVREAALAGLPIVASAIGGVPELLRDTPRVGLVAPGDAAALAAALSRALTWPRRPAAREAPAGLLESLEALLSRR